MKRTTQIAVALSLFTAPPMLRAQEVSPDFAVIAGQSNAEAIPVLEQLLRNPSGASSETIVSARQALAQRAGLGSYYFGRLKTLFDADSPAADTEMKALFRVLGTVPSNEAIMAVAEFLDANTRRERKASNPDEETPDEAAAQTLGSLRLPDAPVRKPPTTYTAEDYAAWREWLAACASGE